jgi:hypothetical protein
MPHTYNKEFAGAYGQVRDVIIVEAQEVMNRPQFSVFLRHSSIKLPMDWVLLHAEATMLRTQLAVFSFIAENRICW